MSNKYLLKIPEPEGKIWSTPIWTIWQMYFNAWGAWNVISQNTDEQTLKPFIELSGSRTAAVGFPSRRAQNLPNTTAEISWDGVDLVCNLLEGTARYAGLLLATVEGFGLGFFAFRAKKELSCCLCLF